MPVTLRANLLMRCFINISKPLLQIDWGGRMLVLALLEIHAEFLMYFEFLRRSLLNFIGCGLLPKGAAFQNKKQATVPIWTNRPVEIKFGKLRVLLWKSWKSFRRQKNYLLTFM